MFLLTDRDDVWLKLIDPSDAQAIFSCIDRSRDHLRAWLPFVDGTKSVDDTLSFIKSVQEQYGRNDGIQTGIWTKDGLQGIIGFHAVDWVNRKTSLGYWLSADAVGNGYMTAACRALTTFAFDYYQLNRVEVRAAEDNHASRAIPQRLGFREEGILHEVEWLYDHFVDHVVYAMMAGDWAPERRQGSTVVANR
ncbi:GNAT family N-acetyltransferase [Alicyclobacillus dauci]|uniref:GNAT family N-acetyltransferase n=1 Tax=Alicyclobacillus dauci TaxID=1475485 RepID=A0ABY6Z757_9BACL|nr:GNAT family protein [Alicyclobacillus dauci]WAH38716.1 GNAT family N-acetyltransferase [Alicyclobacillus dauci]